MCALQRERGGGWGGGWAGGVDVEKVMRPESKCHQYLSSMAKCAHVSSAPFFSHSWYDESEVMNNEFIICVQHTSTLSLVVAPCDEKFGGKMFVIFACHFSNKV